ncbi:MAG: MBL fold metallo-hydrolase [Anaerolineales bacterium]|nr:MBL fold metallo-hydrolase [Anaerolineales bacterium]
MAQNKNGETPIHTLDLNFMDTPGAIASYLIPHEHGAVLVECGPGSTVPALKNNLQAHGFKVTDITDVLLTHIHLDHGGAAGWLARQGARIHVHPVGAPHLIDPEKLLSSAARIYGDLMQKLWGEFLPVPPEKLAVPQDGDVIEIGKLRFRAVDTPGHAYHHYVYIFEDICFTGDVGGVRLDSVRHLRLPTPPPEFHLEIWRESLNRLMGEFSHGAFQRIAPTHFGVFSDAAWHLAELHKALDDIEAWMEAVMPADPSIETIHQEFMSWTEQRSLNQGLDPNLIRAYELANPSWMSPPGIERYWRKNRKPTDG